MTDILYVEDSQDTAEAVKSMLSSVGYNIDLAFNGFDGLKKINEKKFDLILLDIKLPDISGIEIFNQIKNMKRRCVFLSSLPLSSLQLLELKNQGALGYISKPFTKSELILKVNEHLSKSEPK